MTDDLRKTTKPDGFIVYFCRKEFHFSHFLKLYWSDIPIEEIKCKNCNRRMDQIRVLPK